MGFCYSCAKSSRTRMFETQLFHMSFIRNGNHTPGRATGRAN